MNRVIVVLLTIIATAAQASEPGQPLDCSDWVVLEPGVTCATAIPPDCSASPWCLRGSTLAVDNEGGSIIVTSAATGSCGNATTNRTRIVRRVGDQESTVAYVDARCDGALDTMDALNPTLDILEFVPTAGRLFVPLTQNCRDIGGTMGNQCTYDNRVWLAQFDGFASLFDVLQSFAPQAGLFSFRVPYMPEGLAAADHFDTYWGALTHPIDFSQAHGLSCDYPATPPAVGDYLEVADTLPEPTPGQGYWYLTSATYQGQTRFGRKASGGRMSGRDPGAFPACLNREAR